MILCCVTRRRGWFLVLPCSQHPRFPIKQAVTSCPAKRPRVTNARAECSQSCVSLHPSQPSVRKIGATCHPLRIRPFVAGGDSDSSHRLQVFNAFIIRDLMILSLTRHLQRNLLRIQQLPCARKELACVIHWFPPRFLLYALWLAKICDFFFHLRNMCARSFWSIASRIECDSLIKRKRQIVEKKRNFWK